MQKSIVSTFRFPIWINRSPLAFDWNRNVLSRWQVAEMAFKMPFSRARRDAVKLALVCSKRILNVIKKSRETKVASKSSKRISVYAIYLPAFIIRASRKKKKKKRVSITYGQSRCKSAFVRSIVSSDSSETIDTDFEHTFSSSRLQSSIFT